ncbi:MAG: caspase family protein [Gemmatimonadota bacterium]|nr:caspase family protein [Gemmatimonadota bacterium]
MALLIGIGDYQHFGEYGEIGRTDLRGPPNDVERMRKSLERFGFTGEDVRIVRDAEASRAGVAEAFRWVAARASGPEDTVVIFYSGHGSFSLDLDGDEADAVPGDTLDEGLVPWDASDIHDPDQLVLDDQIRRWLAEIPTPNVTMIVDACYSGTMTRGDVSATPKGPLAPGGEGTAMDLTSAAGHTLITAAAPSQVAYEWRPKGSDLYFGKLTYFLTGTLDAADPSSRYDEIMARVEREVASSGSPSEYQTPQLEGDRGARLFHVSGDLPRRAYVTLTSSADALKIDAGAVHGVRPSALYEVYPPGEKEFREGGLGTIRIDSVDLESSSAVPVEGGEGIPSGARAVLSRFPPGAERIDGIEVLLGEGAGGLVETLEPLEFVSVSSERSGTDARITRRGDGYVVWVGADSLPPQSEDVQAGRTVTVAGAGILYRGTAGALCRPLRRAFAIAAFEAIENPVNPGRSEVRLAFVPAGARPSEHQGFAPDTVVVGRSYDLWARVDAPRDPPLYLTIAIEGYSSDPFVVWPPPHEMNRPFAIGRWARLHERISVVEPAGGELLIAVVGPAQFDFHSLVRSLPTCETIRGSATSEFRHADQPANSWQSFRHALIIEKP